MELATLLTVRPDLVTPAPAGAGALAARAARRLSVERALGDLDQFCLGVIELLAVLPRPVPVSRLRDTLQVPEAPVCRCLAALRARALVWEDRDGSDAIHPAPGLRAAALYAELARAAGLLAASGWSGGEWLPSHTFDSWRDAAPADRWVALASAWLATTRVPGLAGARDESGRLRSALGAGRR